MEQTLPRITRYDVAGTNEVGKVRFASNEAAGSDRQAKPGTGRVYINAAQYFQGVPEEVWNMYIGGYKVAEKWLKDRKGRQLSYDELEHYQSIIAALARTLELQGQLDRAIEKSGGWPLR
jgi:hypothetical protein